MPKAKHDSHSIAAGSQDFAATRWSVVIAAGKPSSPDSHQALASLCETYWRPLYAFIRRRVTDSNEAHDLTQAFFAELLSKNYVADAKSERGRFRAFLLTAFKHFASKEWERANAQKRGGGKAPISLDFDSADSRCRIEPACNLTPEQIYDREWAVALLGQVMHRLEEEFQRAGKQRLFLELKPFLIGETTTDGYADVAVRLEMTEAATKMAAHRMRRQYRDLLRKEIAQTVSSPDDVEDEIRNLFVALEK